MRRSYPYLADLLNDNENVSAYKREILDKLIEVTSQKQYTRITLLDWEENPLKEIQGEVTGGTINKDGSSSIRRSGSISTTLSSNSYNIDSIKMDYSINKKVFIELGVENTTGTWEDYPILWFPQGVFFIAGISLNAGGNGNLTLTVTLKDKMLRLNGSIGGLFPYSTDIDTDDEGNKITIYDLITEVVHHNGGEPLQNIVIEDVDQRATRVIKWCGDRSVYLHKQSSSTSDIYSYILSYDSDPPNECEYAGQADTGDNIGYEITDLVYSDTLSVNAGDNVVTVLDKIKNYLGNYEYFYDVFGIFHFQAIKNYVNTSQSSTLLDDMTEKNYFLESYSPNYVYAFNSNKNLVQLSVTPSYENIKNEYVIIGTKQGTSDNAATNIEYHLAIDTKPDTGNSYTNMIIYNYNNSKVETAGRKVCAFPIDIGYSEDLPDIGITDMVYRVANGHEILGTTETAGQTFPNLILACQISNVPLEGYQTLATGNSQLTDLYFRWYSGNYQDQEVNQYILVDPIQEYYTDKTLESYITTDWRTDIYLQSLLNSISGTSSTIDSDYADTYGMELKEYWPQLYDLENQKFYTTSQLLITTDNSVQNIADQIYFLDFIDPNESSFGEFSINNIGRRTSVIRDNDINCMFEPIIPNINYLYTGGGKSDEEKKAEKEESIAMGRPWAQVNDEFYPYFGTGKEWNSAFERVRYELYLHTNYQKSLSITSLPIFYLEPSVLARVEDINSNTYGDYYIKSISLTLGAGKTMTVSATENFSRTNF